MSNRVRIAIGVAFVAVLLASITVFAKGGFSFISIRGENLKEEIRSSDPALTEDFFTFADFSLHKTSAPANPGAGYEITRYYVDGKREIPFDRLQYYPETGFVYYDGIVNGSSEYDGEWYTAKTEIKAVFESALSVGSMSQIQSSASTAQTQPDVSLPPAFFVAVTALGLALILSLTSKLRKSVS